MKIGIMGSGGVGGYYGGLLLRAGHEVTLIARGAHLKALSEKGLVVKSVFEDFVVSPVRVTSDPAQVGLGLTGLMGVNDKAGPCRRSSCVL